VPRDGVHARRSDDLVPAAHGRRFGTRKLFERNLKTIGILGTRTVMETRLYRGISSTAVVLPEGEALEQVHKSYIEMAIAGRVTDAQRHTFFSIGHLCRVRGADAVMLGGTDLCLAFEGQDCGFPVLDCAKVHVEALYKKSVARV
jgi:aspartate racemase